MVRLMTRGTMMPVTSGKETIKSQSKGDVSSAKSIVTDVVILEKAFFICCYLFLNQGLCLSKTKREIKTQM